MYRFTNGIVVYDEETRDKYLKAGMILVKEENDETKTKSEPIKREPEREQRETRENSKTYWR